MYIHTYNIHMFSSSRDGLPLSAYWGCCIPSWVSFSLVVHLYAIQRSVTLFSASALQVHVRSCMARSLPPLGSSGLLIHVRLSLSLFNIYYIISYHIISYHIIVYTYIYASSCTHHVIQSSTSVTPVLPSTICIETDCYINVALLFSIIIIIIIIITVQLSTICYVCRIAVYSSTWSRCICESCRGTTVYNLPCSATVPQQLIRALLQLPVGTEEKAPHSRAHQSQNWIVVRSPVLTVQDFHRLLRPRPSSIAFFPRWRARTSLYAHEGAGKVDACNVITKTESLQRNT